MGFLNFPPPKKVKCCQSVLLGGGLKYFFIFTPHLGKIPILTNIFQMGWFNHQLVVEFLTFQHGGWACWMDGLRRATANSPLRGFGVMKA